MNKYLRSGIDENPMMDMVLTNLRLFGEIRISLGRNNWTKREYLNLRKVMNCLKDYPVTIQKGFWNGSSGRRTLLTWKGDPIDRLVTDSSPLIIFRDDRGKDIPHPVDFLPDEFSRRTTLLENLNRTLQKAPPYPSTCTSFPLYRYSPIKFNCIYTSSSMYRGGRFYGLLQNLPKKERKNLLMDGSPVSERDYSSLHLRILHGLLGKELQEDPYEFPGLSRETGKKLMMILLGSPDKTVVTRAVNRWLSPEERPLLPGFIEKNKTISQFFCCGFATILQKRDSLLAEDIIRDFTKREIPILPVHDSFVVPEKHQDLLEETMISTWMRNYPKTSCSIH
jgi:hypothetical protein